MGNWYRLTYNGVVWRPNCRSLSFSERCNWLLIGSGMTDTQSSMLAEQTFVMELPQNVPSTWCFLLLRSNWCSWQTVVFAILSCRPWYGLIMLTGILIYLITWSERPWWFEVKFRQLGDDWCQRGVSVIMNSVIMKGLEWERLMAIGPMRLSFTWRDNVVSGVVKWVLTPISHLSSYSHAIDGQIW